MSVEEKSNILYSTLRYDKHGLVQQHVLVANTILILQPLQVQQKCFHLFKKLIKYHLINILCTDTHDEGKIE